MAAKGKVSEKEWFTIRKMYEAGLKTVREISDMYGISHVALLKKAKREGWQQGSLLERAKVKAGDILTGDLAEKYYDKAVEKTDDAIIDATAKALVEITHEHSALLKKQRGLLNKYMEELDLLYSEELADRMRILKLATDCAKTIVELERKILGMDKENNTLSIEADNKINIKFIESNAK